MSKMTYKPRFAMVGMLFIILMIFIFIYPLSIVNFSGLDWYNHIWMANYYGKFVIENASVPNFIYQRGVTGDAFPLYYGFTLHGISGLISILIGAKAAVILVCLMALAIGIFLWFHFARLAGCNNFLSALLAVAASITSYQTTNFFSRGALTEFFAFQCLIIAISLVGIFILTEENKKLLCLMACGFFTMCATTHPPTTMISAFVLIFYLPVIIYMTLWTPRIRSKLKTHIFPLCFFVIVTIVIIIAFNYPFIRTIGTLKIESQLSLIYNEFDQAFSRLMPIPIDPRVFYRLQSTISTPNLAAPLSIPLLMLFIALTLRKRYAGILSLMPIVFTTMACFIYLTICSIAGVGENFYPNFFIKTQFACRLVNFCNFSLIFGIFLNLIAAQNECNQQEDRPNDFLLGFITSIMLLSSVYQCYTIIDRDKSPNGLDAMLTASFVRPYERISTFYGYGDFSQNLSPRPNVESNTIVDVQFIPESSDHLGNHNAVQVTCNMSNGCFVKTNVFTSSWFLLTVDGKPVKQYTDGDKLGFFVEQGYHMVWLLEDVPKLFSMFRNLIVIFLTPIFLLAGFIAIIRFFSVTRF